LQVVQVVLVTEVVLEVLEAIGHLFLESHRVVELQRNHLYFLLLAKVIQ
jgi:hypothetical protein